MVRNTLLVLLLLLQLLSLSNWFWCMLLLLILCREWFFSVLISSGLSSGEESGSRKVSSTASVLTWGTPFSVPSMTAFSGSMFCIELVMSSHSGGRRNESSASEHSVSRCLLPKKNSLP